MRLREIGDVVFTTPAVHALRVRFPDAHITYIVEPHAAPVVVGNPHLSEIIVAPRRRGLAGLFADVALGRRLWRGHYDIAIDFHGGPRASLLTWLSRAPERIGYAVVGRSWVYTRRVARPQTLRARHSVLNQWDLVAGLGIAEPDRTQAPVEMAADATTAAAVATRLSAAGVAEDDLVVVIHVSAGNPFRRWPLEHFVTLASSLASRPGERCRIIIVSGPSEGDAAERVVAGARARLAPEAVARVLSCGEFSLTELRALLDRAALYIGGDSGPLHVAATTRVPIVGLYGPTLPERSAPWRDPACPTVSIDAGALPCRPCDQRVCAPGDFRCLTTIAPERVAKAALRLVSGAGAPRPTF